MSNRSKVAWLVLFIVVLASVATNVYLIRMTLDLQNQLIATSAQAEQTQEALTLLENSVEETSGKANKALTTASDVKSQIDSTAVMIGIAIDYLAEQLEAIEQQEFSVVVPIDQELPIDTTVSLNQEVNIPFNESIPINTTVTVPIQVGLIGPFDVDIPINTTVPINLDLNVPISQEIPIKTVVPIKLDFPITISLKDTEIGAQLTQWREALNQVRDLQNGNAAQE